MRWSAESDAAAVIAYSGGLLTSPPEKYPELSVDAGGGGNFGSEIGFFLLDALAESIDDETRHLDRSAGILLGVLDDIADLGLAIDSS